MARTRVQRELDYTEVWAVANGLRTERYTDWRGTEHLEVCNPAKPDAGELIVSAWKGETGRVQSVAQYRGEELWEGSADLLDALL